MRGCRDVKRHPFTALSVPSLYVWREEYGFTLWGDGETYLIRSRHDGGYYCPVGREETCRMLIAQLRESGEKLLYLTQEQAEELTREGWTARRRDDLSEYLVSVAAEALREGHVSKSFREKCHRFKRQYRYTTRPIGPAELPILYRMLDALPNDPREKNMQDLSVLRTELDDFAVLGMRGLLMETAEGEYAFVLGYEDTPESFTVSMGKHTSGLPTETSTVIVHELAQMLDGEYKLFNLEEDLGLEGLRNAKALYSPVGRLEVYEATPL